MIDSTEGATNGDAVFRRWKTIMAVGRMDYDSGCYSQAARHFQSALDCIQKYSLDDSLRARTLLNLAKSVAALGNFEKAEQMMREVISIDESDTSSLLDDAEDYHQLSLLYWRKGQLAQSMQCAKKAMNLVERSQDSPDDIVAKLLKHLAVLAQERGELKECEDYLNKAIEFIICSSMLGRQSSIYGDVLLVKVLLLAEQGDFAGAAELYPQAMQIIEINRGLAHPAVHEVMGIFGELNGHSECRQELLRRITQHRSHLIV